MTDTTRGSFHSRRNRPQGMLQPHCEQSMSLKKHELYHSALTRMIWSAVENNSDNPLVACESRRNAHGIAILWIIRIDVRVTSRNAETFSEWARSIRSMSFSFNAISHHHLSHSSSTHSQCPRVISSKALIYWVLKNIKLSEPLGQRKYRSWRETDLWVPDDRHHEWHTQIWPPAPRDQ